MRITKQSSGGRGEYELCDYAPNGLLPVDLLQGIIHLKVDDLVINTGVRVTHAQGKYRLRLSKDSDQHAYSQIAVALLLPQPVRDEQIIASGEPVLQNGGYLIKNLNFGDVSGLTHEEDQPYFTAELITVDAANKTVLAKQIAAIQRLQDIKHIWRQKSKLPSEVSTLLAEHERLVRSKGPLPKASRRIVKDLQAETERYTADLELGYSKNTDVVPILLELTDQAQMPQPVSLNEIEPDNIELRKREINRWQVYAQRRGAAFRKRVRDAYNCRCLICSARFPSTSVNLRPGIDAAHILPWAEYDIDEVYNGIALCKLHHWAFDERLLQIAVRAEEYYVELSKEAEEYLQLPEFSIDVLRRSVGKIPSELLPSRRRDWPSPKLLERLYNESL